ncbi:MAG: phosphatase PAP2 family protein [Chloroflexota bacterium]
MVVQAKRTAPHVAPMQEWRRADGREFILLGAYFLALVLLADALNVRLGVELMTVAVLVAAAAITRAPRQFVRDWWFFLIGLVLWNLSGPIAAYSPFPWHLDFMLNLDHIIGLGHQPAVLVQHAFATPGRLGPIDWASAFFYNLHVPEPYIAGYFLWRLSRLAYLRFAAAALLLLVLGLITFILFPAVPPWLATKEFGRLPNVTNLFGTVLHGYPMPFHGTPIFYVFHFRGDPVAAFPSEHAAFPLLEFLAFKPLLGKPGWLYLIWPAIVLFVILYLGEHWVTDALAGWVFALAITFGVRRLTGTHLAGIGRTAKLASR